MREVRCDLGNLLAKCLYWHSCTSTSASIQMVGSPSISVLADLSTLPGFILTGQDTTLTVCVFSFLPFAICLPGIAISGQLGSRHISYPIPITAVPISKQDLSLSPSQCTFVNWKRRLRHSGTGRNLQHESDLHIVKLPQIVTMNVGMINSNIKLHRSEWESCCGIETPQVHPLAACLTLMKML